MNCSNESIECLATKATSICKAIAMIAGLSSICQAQLCEYPVYLGLRLDLGVRPLVGVIGDFEGDGDLDMAVHDLHDSDVNILLNNGKGFYEPRTIYSVDAEPMAIALGIAGEVFDLTFTVQAHEFYYKKSPSTKATKAHASQ